VSSTRPRAIVVSGAGTGLGADVAARLARDGVLVGVLDRDGDAARRTAEALQVRGLPLVADVTDEAALVAALDEFARLSGADAPDGAVCNAGVVRFGPLAEVGLDDWRQVVEVNLTGTFLTARSVARRMLDAGRPGSIVTVTSVNGVLPGPGAGAYGATKAAVARLTEQMALEWAHAGIRVNAVAPGLIDAGMSAAVLSDPEVRAARASAVPLGRLGTGVEVADAVAYLLSDESSYVTGTELLVDGGVGVSALARLPRSATAAEGSTTTADGPGASDPNRSRPDR